MTDKTQTIRSLNDRFRQQAPGTTDVPGRVVITQGIQNLTDTDREPGKYLAALFGIIRNYDDFNKDNDPYQERDFGVFDFRGSKCFWKLDYYDPTLKWGSEDPADTTKTCRVLTVMLASEY